MVWRTVSNRSAFSGGIFQSPISSKHAILEIKRGDYFLKDCGSTNGTTLKGERLQDKPVHLSDRDVISFGRYEFTFLFPGSLCDMLMAA